MYTYGLIYRVIDIVLLRALRDDHGDDNDKAVYRAVCIVNGNIYALES